MSDDTFSDVTADEIQLLEVLERMDAEGIAITGAITRAHLEADKPAEGDHDEGQNPGTSPARKLQMCFERMSRLSERDNMYISLQHNLHPQTIRSAGLSGPNQPHHRSGIQSRAVLLYLLQHQGTHPHQVRGEDRHRLDRLPGRED